MADVFVISSLWVSLGVRLLYTTAGRWLRRNLFTLYADRCCAVFRYCCMLLYFRQWSPTKGSINPIGFEFPLVILSTSGKRIPFDGKSNWRKHEKTQGSGETTLTQECSKRTSVRWWSIWSTCVASLMISLAAASLEQSLLYVYLHIGSLKWVNKWLVTNKTLDL